MPRRAEMVGREATARSAARRHRQRAGRPREAAGVQREVGALESRLADLRAVLPEEKDAADLLRRMQTVAVQSNLTIKSFKPAPVVTKQLHAEWPINLELDGTYHNLALFFDRVGKFTRIVNISGLGVRGHEKPGSRRDDHRRPAWPPPSSCSTSRMRQAARPATAKKAA